MRKRHDLLAVILLLFAPTILIGLSHSFAAEPRIWTDSTGQHQLKGTLRDFDPASGNVFLTMLDGNRKVVEYRRLSGWDQEFVLIHAPAVRVADPLNLTSTARTSPAAASSAALANVLSVLYSDPKYQPITLDQIGQSKKQLRESMTSLERQMAEWGELEARWKRYLHWDELRARADDANFDDLELLKKVADLLSVDRPGLERREFLELRGALAHHLRILQLAGETVDGGEYSQRLAELERLLTAAGQEPLPTDIERIGLHLGWLQEHGQLTADVDTIRRSFARPNVYLRVSRAMLAANVSRNVNEASDVRDVILGTEVFGRGYTTGRVTLQPVADHRRAVFDLNLYARTTTDTVGYNDPVRIYSDGQTDVRATKRFVLDADGIHDGAAHASAETSTYTRDIATDLPPVIDLFVRRIAEREVERSQAESNAIAAGRAEVQFNARLDHESRRMSQTANADYRERIRNPLLRRESFPRQIEFATTSDALLIKALQADLFHLGAPDSPPESFRQADLGICVYESAINSWLAKSLAGVTIQQSALRNKMVQWLPQIANEAPVDAEELEITFDEVQPLTVRFDGAALTMTIRGQKFFARDQTLPAMNIVVRYDLRQQDGAWQLVLNGEPVIEPPRADANDDGRLSLKELTLRRLLINRLDRGLPKEIAIERLQFNQPGIGLVALNCTRLAAEKGWFTAVLKLPHNATPDP